MVYGNDEPPSNSYRNAFVITHGIGSNQQIYNDVWSFDFIRECWVEIKATGNKIYTKYKKKKKKKKNKKKKKKKKKKKNLIIINAYKYIEL